MTTLFPLCAHIVTAMVLGSVAASAAADSAGKPTRSGVLPVMLSFDRKGEPASETSSTERSGDGDTYCSGGGLVGRMNCFTNGALC